MKNSEILISVVIVNYNSGNYLHRCLESLYNVETPIHIIVVDNASSDDSLDKIPGLNSSLHKITLIRNEQNYGFAKAVNIGAQKVSSEYLMLLNPDCHVHPHSLAKLMQVLQAYPSAGIVGALVFNEDGSEQRGCRRNEPTLRRSIVTALGLGRWFDGVDLTNRPLLKETIEMQAVSGSAMMFKRTCFDQINGMDESYFLHCEDLDICKRARLAGFQVLFSPEVSIIHRQGVSGGSTFSEVERYKHDGMINYYTKHYAKTSVMKAWLAKGLVTVHFYQKKLRHQIHLRAPKRLQKNIQLFQKLPNIKKRYILVTGINTDIGDYLLKSLGDKHSAQVIAVSRQSRTSDSLSSVTNLTMEYFEKAPSHDIPTFSEWIHLAPVWTAKEFESLFVHGLPEQIIAVSSTSAEIKEKSKDVAERKVVKQLRDGEEWLQNICHHPGTKLTILRPTLIYGGPRNKNINLIRKCIRLFRFFPLVGDGNGLRQPVHAKDIATAVLSILKLKTATGIYNIGGNEKLTYKAMVSRIFAIDGYSPRFLPMPLGVVRTLLQFLSFIPGLKMLNAEMADRMQDDLTFDNLLAQQDFSYQPSDFTP